MNRKIILVRHAHREILQSREADNGLSEKGIRQAERIRKYFDENYEISGAYFYSSPKKRCVETIQDLAEDAERVVEERPELDEEGDLTEKTTRFKTLLEKSDAPLIVACSHGDWIPVFLDRFGGKWINLEKGGLVELELSRSGLKIRKIVQAP